MKRKGKHVLASRLVSDTGVDGVDGERRARRGRERKVEGEHRVVLEVLADSGERHAARDAKRGEHGRAADARELEELRGLVRPCRCACQ